MIEGNMGWGLAALDPRHPPGPCFLQSTPDPYGIVENPLTAIQFGCPWCGAVAEIDAALSGQQALCPACDRLLIVPTTAPEAMMPPAPAMPPATSESAVVEPPPLSAAAPWPADFASQPPVVPDVLAPSSEPRSTQAAAPATIEKPATEDLSLKEKARRKTQRNLVMLACGLMILFLALALLLQLSGK